jgi:hypothetical protein
MTVPDNRRIWALALGLVLAGLAAGRAEAASMTNYTYSAVGSVDTPAGGVANLVYFDGLNNASTALPSDGTGGSINLGRLVVSSLAKTTDQTYTNTPFHIIASVGSNSSQQINGVINGSVGPDAKPASLTATFTSITPFGNNPLPFALNLPLNQPMTLQLTDGTTPAPTGLVSPAAIPEPASVAVFAVALGGLGLWRRRVAR